MATGLAALAHVLAARMAGDTAVALVAAAAVGGAALVCIVLVEVDRRLRRIESRQGQHHQTTERILNRGLSRFGGISRALADLDRSPVDSATVEGVIRAGARVPAETPSLAVGLANAQLRRMARFLDGLDGGEIIAETESRDWLLGLTARAGTSLRGVVTSDVARHMDRDLIDRCSAAVVRGVTVAWTVIVDATTDADDAVRALRSTDADVSLVKNDTIASWWSDTDSAVIVFDDEIVHETQLGAPTCLILDPDQVTARVHRVDAILGRASPD